MARFNFGGALTDFAITPPSARANAVFAQPNATGSVYAARTGGSALTDLLDSNGSATTTVSSDANGFVNRFQGPDGYTILWVDFGGGSRFQMRTVDTAFYRVDAPEKYGAVGDGVTDDSTAIQSAINSAHAAGGGTVLLAPRTYRITTSLSLSGKKNVRLLGSGFSRPFGATIKWAGADSGSALVCDTGEGIAIEGIQWTCSSSTFAGTLLDFRGSGGGSIHVDIVRNFFSGISDLHTDIETGVGNTYSIRQNDFYRSSVAINGQTNTPVASSVQTLIVENNFFSSLRKFRHITNPGANWHIRNNSVEPLSNGNPGFVSFTGSFVGAGVSIDDNWCGDVVTGTAGTAQLELVGTIGRVSGNTFGVGTGASAMKALGNVNGMMWVGNRIVSTGGGSGKRIDWGTGLTHLRCMVLGGFTTGPAVDTGDIPSTLVQQADTGATVGMILESIDSRPDKAMVLRIPGTGAAASTGTYNVQVWNGSAYVDGIIAKSGSTVVRNYATLMNRQTLAANGAVAFDAALGDHQVTLQANATSSSISNAAAGRKLTISFRQDATGGRTYAWPTNCVFAGGVAPSDATANKQTSVTFRWDDFVSKWYEESRAVAVG